MLFKSSTRTIAVAGAAAAAAVALSATTTGVHAFAPTYRLAPRSWHQAPVQPSNDLRASSSTRLFVSSIQKQQELEKQKIKLEQEQLDLQTVKLDLSAEDAGDDSAPSQADLEFKKGFATIGFITLLNASLSPVWHVVFENGGPPPLFLNAVISVVALSGLLLGAPLLDGKVEKSSALAASQDDEKWSKQSFRGGMELGFWKGLGTTCHVYGLALTSANHGAFFLQLTTLIVPVIQGLKGERIPRQVQLAVVLALAGIAAFTQDGGGANAIAPPNMQLGDMLCIGAAIFYSVYDIQTFYWGRVVPRTELVTIKVGFQAFLSCLLCYFAASGDVMDYLQAVDGPQWGVVVPTVLWSGLFVNALATFLQVGGMQSVGPTRAQTIFASQPLWAASLNYVFLGEVLGLSGFVGGGAFLAALGLAATADIPKPGATETDN